MITFYWDLMPIKMSQFITHMQHDFISYNVKNIVEVVKADIAEGIKIQWSEEKTNLPQEYLRISPCTNSHSHI